MTASKNSVTCFSSLKGNSQFIFLHNPPKSNASRFHTKFPQKTKKILSTDTVYWLELITIILSILKIFSLKKTAVQFFNISENLQENQRKHHISSIYRPLKVNYEWYMWLLTLHRFFVTLIAVLCISSIIFPYLYLPFLIFFFTFLFLPWSPQDTFYNLQSMIELHCNHVRYSIQYSIH